MNPNTPALLRNYLDVWSALQAEDLEVLLAIGTLTDRLRECAVAGESLNPAIAKEFCDKLDLLQAKAVHAIGARDDSVTDLLHDLQYVGEVRFASEHGDPHGLGDGKVAPGSVEAAVLRQLQRLGWTRMAGDLVMPDGTTWTMKAEQPGLLEHILVVLERAVTPTQKQQKAISIVRWNRHDGRDGNRLGLLFQTMVMGDAIPDRPAGSCDTWHVQLIEVPESYRNADDADGTPD